MYLSGDNPSDTLYSVVLLSKYLFRNALFLNTRLENAVNKATTPRMTAQVETTQHLCFPQSSLMWRESKPTVVTQLVWLPIRAIIFQSCASPFLDTTARNQNLLLLQLPAWNPEVYGRYPCDNRYMFLQQPRRLRVRELHAVFVLLWTSN